MLQGGLWDVEPGEVFTDRGLLSWDGLHLSREAVMEAGTANLKEL